MDRRSTDPLLRRVLGIETETDREEIARLRRSDPEWRRFERLFSEGWEIAERVLSPDPERAEALLARIMAGEFEGEDLDEEPFEAGRSFDGASAPGGRLRGVGRIAATLLLLGAGMAGAVVLSFHGGSRAGERSYRTGPGEHAEVRLPDGSAVRLGPGTTLSFREPWPAHLRQVSLSGIAEFHPEKESGRPFEVRVREMAVRVLGTRFVVRGFPHDEEVEVGVAEGRVGLRRGVTPDHPGGEPAVVLHPGELGTASLDPTIPIRIEPDAERLFDWTRYRHVFRDRPLRDVLAELALWHGTEFHLPDPAVGERRITLSFQETPLDDVLAAIRQALGVRITREGLHVTIEPSSPPEAPGGETIDSTSSSGV